MLKAVPIASAVPTARIARVAEACAKFAMCIASIPAGRSRRPGA